MYRTIELITRASIVRGEVPNLKDKFVHLDFGHVQARGTVEQQSGTKISLAPADVLDTGICRGINLGWDSFVSGVALS